MKFLIKLAVVLVLSATTVFYMRVHRSAAGRAVKKMSESSACIKIEEEAEEHDDELAEKDVAWVGSVCTHFSASFRNCCRSLYPPISRSCSNLCTFTMTIDQFKASFSKGMPPCQNDELQKVLACAADDADVRNCCEQNGVFDDTSRHCLQFCHPSNKVLWNTFFTADIRYLRCVDFYEAFMYCFLQGRLRSVLNIQS